MAFKFLLGKESDLPNDKAFGHIYGCTDSGNLFFDFISTIGKVARLQINAAKADALRYTENGTEKQLVPGDIATKTELATKIATTQGLANSGKILGVNAQGNVAPMAVHGLGSSGTLTWGDLVDNNE